MEKTFKSWFIQDTLTFENKMGKTNIKDRNSNLKQHHKAFVFGRPGPQKINGGFSMFSEEEYCHWFSIKEVDLRTRFFLVSSQPFLCLDFKDLYLLIHNDSWILFCTIHVCVSSQYSVRKIMHRLYWPKTQTFFSMCLCRWGTLSLWHQLGTRHPVFLMKPYVLYKCSEYCCNSEFQG